MHTRLLRTTSSAVVFWSLLALMCPAAVLQADELTWGTVRGRIVFSGEIPARETLEITRDEEVCGLPGLQDESLLIHPQNRGIANFVVFLDSRDEVPVHPTLSALVQKPVELDNKGCRFIPRIVPLQTGQTLRMLNTDPVVHNAAAYLKRSIPFNEVIPSGKPSARQIGKAERAPARIDCSVHPWMRAWLVVLDHPYSVVTNADGQFEMKLVPAGEHTFHFWHEQPGSLQELQIQNELRQTTRGTISLSIPAGDVLDLGDIQVKAEQLQSSGKRR
jgi:plastocyanin